MPPVSVGILATHPIQYYSPLYRAVAATPGIDLTVYFAHRPTPEEQGVGFGVAFEWDVDLLGGYEHRWLVNRSATPGVAEFGGCDTPEVASAIAAARHDVFLVMGWHSKSYWQAMLACWRSGVPLLVRGDSQLDPAAPLPRRVVKRMLYPRFVSRFAACLSVGQRSAEYFLHYGARRVVRSPHFVDNPAFARAADAARASRPAVRAAWGLPERALVVLFAGKFIPKKRPLDVIRGTAALGRSDAHVLMVGDGELRSACESEARRLGVPLRIAGFLNQSEIPVAYAAADVLVLPSDRRETWGLVVNEAMASGTPAIVSEAAGCAPDLIRAGVTGWSFPVGDIAALAARLGEAASEGRLGAAGGAARRHIAGFSVEAASAGVIEGVRLAVPRGRRARG